MQLSKYFLIRNYKYLFGILLILGLSALSLAFQNNSDEFDNAKREVILRGIGHQLLLQSGDRTSRVLPITKIAENEYQLNFQNELAFKPDSLVSTTRRLLLKDQRASEYLVKVMDSGTAKVAYGFAVSKNKKDDILSCKGREYPKARYVIKVNIKPPTTNSTERGILIGGIPLLAFVGFMFFRSAKPIEVRPVAPNSETFTFGSVLFEAQKHQVTIGELIIDLTGTETRLLQIFASSPNQIIERSRLQKEIWEDEGIIVGRSLDMFISKLRKKLDADPTVKIVNIRAKGYKLSMNSF
jgi:DNA-binding winged helix-turn-helix (wHTH) protein